MVNKQVVLVLLAVTLFGSLSGFIITLVKPVRYQAEAYVVVYDMPRGLNDILSPDEAAHLDDVYRAGVLQDEVLKQVRTRLPEYSSEDIAHAIQVEIVAYTPFTRITATATTAVGAATLANEVATAWTSVAGAANQKAYDDTKTTLVLRESAQLKQLATIQNALKAAEPSSDSAAQLKAQAHSLQDAINQTSGAILGLDKTRYDVVGNAYVEIFAKASDAVRTPDPAKNVAVGGAIGISLGIVLAIWLTMRRRNRDFNKATPQAAAAFSLGPGHGATNEW